MNNRIPSVCQVVPSKEVGQKIVDQMNIYMPNIESRIEDTEFGLLIIADVTTQEEQDLATRLLCVSSGKIQKNCL